MKRNALANSWQALRPTFGLLALLFSALCLQACSTTGTSVMPVPKVLAPELCLQLAPNLPPLADPTLAGAVRNHAEVATLYWQLAEWHECLVMFERGR